MFKYDNKKYHSRNAARPPNTFSVESSLLNVERSNSTGVKPRLRGFTLIELITVMSILTFLIATAVGAYFAWNQTSALRGATDLTLAGLHRARQFAIAHRVDTYVVFECETPAEPGQWNINSFFSLSTNASSNASVFDPVAIAPRKDLPRNISFSLNGGGELPFALYFNSSGRPYYEDGTRFEEDQNAVFLHLQRGGTNFITRAIYIDPLTGVARPQGRDP